MPEVVVTPDEQKDPTPAPTGEVTRDKTGAVSASPDEKKTPAAEKTPWEAAGFKTVEEMGKAYTELRSKMSGKKEETPAPTAESKTETPATEPTEADKALAEKLAKEVTDVVGGADEYARIAAWARANVPEAELKEYNEALASGKLGLAKLAAAGMQARFVAAVGSEGSLVDAPGVTGVGGEKPFMSQAEVVAAMSDPRYKNGDIAYIDSVVRRIEKSKVFG